jgi:hypothetical protein
VLVSGGGNGTQVLAPPDRTPLIRRDPIQLAQHFAGSGFFKDAADMSKAVVKIVAGEELGIGPMAAMTGIHIIDGKPSLSANLLAVQVKRSGRYDYRVLEEDPEHIKLAWFANEEEIGTSEFTVAQAKQANLLGKDNWKHYLPDMLFSRALTRGVRRFCPEVTAGAPAYTPEELGAEVDAQGDMVVHVDSVVEQVPGEQDAKLDEARVAHLIEGIEIVKPTLAESGVNWIDGLNVMLGSLGIDGLEPADDLSPQLSEVSEADANELDAALQALADEEAAKAGEVAANG